MKNKYLSIKVSYTENKNEDHDVEKKKRSFSYNKALLWKIVKYPMMVRNQFAHVINVAILGGIHFDSRAVNFSIVGKFEEETEGADVNFFLHSLVEEGVCYNILYFTTNSRVDLFDIPCKENEYHLGEQRCSVPSSGNRDNIFHNFECPNPKECLIKSKISFEIREIFKLYESNCSLNFNEKTAAHMLGISESEFLNLMVGKFHDFDLSFMSDCLSKMRFLDVDKPPFQV